MSEKFSPSRWALLGREYKEPKCKVCPQCREYRLWSRNTCQICGSLLVEIRDNPTEEHIRHVETLLGIGYWKWEVYKARHQGEKD